MKIPEKARGTVLFLATLAGRNNEKIMLLLKYEK